MEGKVEDIPHMRNKLTMKIDFIQVLIQTFIKTQLPQQIYYMTTGGFIQHNDKIKISLILSKLKKSSNGTPLDFHKDTTAPTNMLYDNWEIYPAQ